MGGNDAEQAFALDRLAQDGRRREFLIRRERGAADNHSRSLGEPGVCAPDVQKSPAVNGGHRQVEQDQPDRGIRLQDPECLFSARREWQGFAAL